MNRISFCMQKVGAKDKRQMLQITNQKIISKTDVCFTDSLRIAIHRTKMFVSTERSWCIGHSLCGVQCRCHMIFHAKRMQSKWHNRNRKPNNANRNYTNVMPAEFKCVPHLWGNRLKRLISNSFWDLLFLIDTASDSRKIRAKNRFSPQFPIFISYRPLWISICLR